MSMAVSKISCTPVISLDEHSMYLAPIFVATALPCCCVTGVSPCVFRSSMHVRLCRRSDLRPQRMIGVVGQKWRTSGYHCRQVSKVGQIRDELLQIRTLSKTFSSEFGQSIAKQTNRRSVSGYESGRSLSYSSCPAVSHSASSTPLPDPLCSTCVM